MYTQPIADNSIPNDMAVVLVGNAGPDTINYLQFTHSLIPAINAHDIVLPPDTVVAIPVPIGTRGLSLTTYTTTTRPGLYLPSGTPLGYMPVRTPPIDITSRGVYFIATLFPNRPGSNFEAEPNLTSLARLRSMKPQLAKLPPMNFAWPR
jgi:hypothetical protein